MRHVFVVSSWRECLAAGYVVHKKRKKQDGVKHVINAISVGLMPTKEVDICHMLERFFESK